MYLKRNYLMVLLGFLAACMVSIIHASSETQTSYSSVIPQNQLERDKQNFDEVRNALWNKYLKDAQNLIELKSEYDNRALTFKDKVMRFSLEKRGTAPQDGYPLYIALHGGGQAPPSVNDSQWQHMKIYYRDSVSNGIYVAPRGVTNNWKLHFEDESYPLYDKLIESAILFDNVNPNRVYLLGFSAGGDGVYQIVPRMPERFAAANMSAGHHNWISFDNLHNTPFLLQVGEYDSAFKRNRVAAENFVTLNNLRAKYGSGYVHDLFIHYGGSHNSWRDNDASRRDQSIIADPEAWLAGDREKKLANTNAIDWLNHYSRNAIPDKLVWDMKVGANDRIYQSGASLVGKAGYTASSLAKPNMLFSWLDVSIADAYPKNGKLVVALLKSSNTIKVEEAKDIDKFRILLNPYLLDLAKPIKVEVNGQVIANIQVKEKSDIMVRTLLERSDKNQIYNAEINLAYNKDAQKWEILND